MFERLAVLVNGDAALVRTGRFCTTELMLAAGERTFHVSVRAGRIEALAEGPFRMRSWRFALRASEDAWRRHLSPVPPPGFQDLLAMAATGAATIEGDVGPLLANLRYVKEVVAAPRRAAAEAP